MEYVGYIVLSLVILLVMVLIHELGHYTAAKILGFTVNEFSVGFGPKLLSRKRKNGEVFSLRAIPLGGYCAFLGEDDITEQAQEDGDRAKQDDKSVDAKTDNDSSDNVKADTDAAAVAESNDKDKQGKNEDLLSYVMRVQIEENNEKSAKAKAPAVQVAPIRLDKNGNPALTFNQQKPWKRIIVLLGGITFNLLSAIIFSFIFIWSVGYAQPIVSEVYARADGSAYCDFVAGDVIKSIGGKEISILNSYNDLVSDYKLGDVVTVVVDRNGELVSLDIARQEIEHTDENGKTTKYEGFGIATMTGFAGNNAGNAFIYCVPYTFKLSWSILGSFGGMITGRVPITDMSGPIGSIKMMADVSIANWRNILLLLPLLASNLAMFNLLPIPALDGCKIIFTLIEWIRKKPINRKVEAIINFVGLVVLMLFVVIVDILSFAL